MASSKEYLDFILEQLSGVENITYRPMMGEFLLYSDGKLFGGIYDDRLLIKKVDNNSGFNLSEQLPYDGAKPMYFVENVDDEEALSTIVRATCLGLK